MLAHCLFFTLTLTYVMTAILTPSVNSTFSQHLCPWTLVGEESTNSFGAPSLEQVLSSWRSLRCKQEVFVLLSSMCLEQKLQSPPGDCKTG